MRRSVIFTALSLVLFAVTVSDVSADSEYVGVDGCNCHKAEIRDWERSKHANAFDLLHAGKKVANKKEAGLEVEVDFAVDQKCVKCHVTGYKKKGGFQSISSTPEMIGVGCEMCHGPGSEYRKLHEEKGVDFKRGEAKKLGQLYGSEDPSVCKVCHENSDGPFTPELDDKYRLDMEKVLKDPRRAFHGLYPLKGDH